MRLSKDEQRVPRVPPYVADAEERLADIAPMGYSLAVNVRLFTPEFYRTTYPDDWVKLYQKRRYALFDPTTIWCRFNDGQVRWSEIDLNALKDIGGHVLEQARKFDLNFGGCVARRGDEQPGIKSLLFGARQDRELSDTELSEMSRILKDIVEAAGSRAGLSEMELQALQDLATGLTHKEIADLRQISPVTVKKRLERAREILGARNAVQAIAIAAKSGLILTDPVF